MIYVVAALVLVGAVAVLNLLLTVGVIRRLREHTEALKQLPGAGASRFLGSGTPLPPLDGVVTVEGAPVEASPVLVAFFSTTCDPCREKLPDLRDHLREVAAPAGDVLVVVEGAKAEAGDFLDALRGLAQIVVEPELGPVAKSFAVDGFPTFYAVDPAGRIVVGSHDVPDLPVPARP
jgi:hypothetical protein